MYISKEQIKGFDSYKYSCIDTSPLSNYVMHPFWNEFVKLFPRWVAPNLLTFAGFMILVAQYVVLAIYDPFYLTSYHGLFPTWVWWFGAFAQFFSHTLDGIDGKQARRTGTSSPLGELFDHGLDSMCVSFFTLNVFSVLGIGLVTVETFYYVLLATLLSFFISHWEKYNTGVLYLPWGYDLSQVSLLFVYILTGLTSVEIWRVELFGVTIKQLLQITFFGTSFAITLPAALYNVYASYMANAAITHSTDNQALQKGTAKRTTLYEIMLPFVSVTLAGVILHTWMIFSPSDVLHTNPRLILFTILVVFSNILCRLIVSQMSGTRCQVINKFIPIIGAAAALSLYLGQPEADHYILLGTTVVLSLAHIHYGLVVVDTLASHLGIRVFSISKKSE